MSIDQKALPFVDSSTTRVNQALRERNKRVRAKVLSEAQEVKEWRAGFKRSYGIDPLDQKSLPTMQEGFSWKKLREKLALREADSSTAFTQFLRAGVQGITNSLYEATPVSYDDWVTTVASSRDTELYAPNHGVSFPRQVGPSEYYPEVAAAALDIKLKNYKFGAVYSLEWELLEDDQTGSFARQAGMLGEYMKVLTEVLVMGKLASVANMQYIDYKVPVSETKPSGETNYPWSQAFIGGGANRPATYTVLTQAGVQAAFVGLMNQKNLQGIKMLVQPNRLIVGPNQQFEAAILAHSAYYPSGAAAAGAVGGAFAINPLHGIYDITVSRFVFKSDGTVTGDSKAWFLVDDSKPWFVLQLREAVSVMQEANNAGMSFNMDQIRYKARSRMNADFLDPRFAWQGNDGSITV